MRKRMSRPHSAPKLPVYRPALLVGAGLASVLYARWLDRNKGLIEPDFTWLEVVFGTAYTLTFAALDERVHRRPLGVFGVFLYFAVTGTPIVIGEIRQAYERAQRLREYDDTRSEW